MLHDDWELNGDGSGDIEKLMLSPAEKIVACCDEFGAKYTFFAEFGQQLAMEQSDEPELKAQADAWKQLLRQSVMKGHDVQLHFHPQWIGAKRQNRIWSLDFTKWSTALLPYAEMKKWLAKGKNYLVDLLLPVNSNYRVVAYRSGGKLVQPSTNLIKVLLDIGIIADCTVVKGESLDNPVLGSTNFRCAPSALIPWYAHEHDMVSMSDEPSGLICIPTFGQTVFLPKALAEIILNPSSIIWGIKRNLSFYKKEKEYQLIYRRHRISIPFENAASFNFLREAFAQRVIPLDFGVYHYKTILYFIKRILRNLEKKNISNIPLILLTHSKNFYCFDNFKRLLAALSTMRKVRFTTTQDSVLNLDKSNVLYKKIVYDQSYHK
jgi:hypothetical protein